jgi:hypothetical protein
LAAKEIQMKKSNNPKRNYFTSLEQVAKLLLKRMVEFNYTRKCIWITDTQVCSDTMVASVSYDFETKEIVLMGPNPYYIEIKHSDFAKYLNSAK